MSYVSCGCVAVADVDGSVMITPATLPLRSDISDTSSVVRLRTSDMSIGTVGQSLAAAAADRPLDQTDRASARPHTVYSRRPPTESNTRPHTECSRSSGHSLDETSSTAVRDTDVRFINDSLAVGISSRQSERQTCPRAPRTHHVSVTVPTDRPHVGYSMGPHTESSTRPHTVYSRGPRLESSTRAVTGSVVRRPTTASVTFANVDVEPAAISSAVSQAARTEAVISSSAADNHAILSATVMPGSADRGQYYTDRHTASTCM